MSIETHEQYLTAKQHFISLLEQLGPGNYSEESDALGEAIEEYETAQGISAAPSFMVRDEDTLAWFVGKVADLESKKKRIQAQADAMIADVQREIDGLQYCYGDQADKVLRSLLTGRKKSVKFLTGTIGLRSTPARVKDGGLDIVALSHFYPEIYKAAVSEKVDYAALNRAVKVVDGQAIDTYNGEVIELTGLQVVPASEKLYVKAGSEDE